jgi:putative transposase
MDDYRVSVRRACLVVLLKRSVWYYQSNLRDDIVIRMRMKEIAMVRVRYWFSRVFTLLRREGFKDNHKRVYRLYKLEGLNLRSKRPRRSRAGAHRVDKPKVEQVNQVWSMDFMADQLFDSKRVRILTLVDKYNCNCHVLEVGQSLKGMDVGRIMNQVRHEYGNLPQRIQVENGSEFISKDFDQWLMKIM